MLGCFATGTKVVVPDYERPNTSNVHPIAFLGDQNCGISRVLCVDSLFLTASDTFHARLRISREYMANVDHDRVA